MNLVLPKYASEFADRHGKPRVRLRRTGWRTEYVHSPVGSPEFTAAYKAWETGAKLEIGAKRVKPGSFDDLIAKFYRSTIWENLKATTQETYRGELERFREKYGERAVATMTAMHIEKLMIGMKETPSAANNLKKRLGQLFDYAIIQKMRTDNPAKAVRSLKTRKGGFPTWQEEQISRFELTHPLGTMPRLAFDLALHTAQRKSDVRVMGPLDTERGKIRVKQLKTGKTLMIPIHPNLARSIAATKTGALAFLISEKGTPFTYDGFGMWFMRHCRKAGLEGFAMHGLRKAASRRMAELGLSNQLIKSITGHSSDTEVARYTRDAEQEKMADEAFLIMSKANLSDPGLATPPQQPENKG